MNQLNSFQDTTFSCYILRSLLLKACLIALHYVLDKWHKETTFSNKWNLGV